MRDIYKVQWNGAQNERRSLPNHRIGWIYHRRHLVHYHRHKKRRHPHHHSQRDLDIVMRYLVGSVYAQAVD